MGGRGDHARASGTSPRVELHALPDLAGKDVVELGCGTAYFGAWLKKAGAARVVGVDPTPAQLETARRCKEKFGLGLEFVEAFGEDVPLPDESFDLVVSEYGASIWADPYKLDPRGGSAAAPGRRARLPPQLDARHPLLARRGRRRGGDAAASAVRDAPLLVAETSGVEYHLPHGEWIRLLRANGFEILDLIEIQAPADAETHEHYAYVTADWARKWPSEEIWRARLHRPSS